MSDSFEAYYAGWLVDQEHYLDRLIRLSTQNDEKQALLIEEVMHHYKSYYEEKAKAIVSGGKSLFFVSSSSPWMIFSDLEKMLFWFGGFRPCLVLSLLEATVVDMSPERRRRVEAVREEVEAEEKAVERVGGPVVRMADEVRREAVVKVVECLNENQTVKFLVAVGSYQLGMKRLGIHFPL